MADNEQNSFGNNAGDQSDHWENPFENIGTDSDAGMNDNLGESMSGSIDMDKDSGLGDDSQDIDIPKTPVADNKKSVKVKKEKKKVSQRKKDRHRKVRPEYTPWLPGDILILLSIVVAFAILIAGDVLAFMWYNMEAANYLIAYTILGAFLVFIPFLLWYKRSYGEVVNLYEALLATSLALVILGCMMVLTAQSLRYGSNYKGNLTGAAEIQMFDKTV